MKTKKGKALKTANEFRQELEEKWKKDVDKLAAKGIAIIEKLICDKIPVLFDKSKAYLFAESSYDDVRFLTTEIRTTTFALQGREIVDKIKQHFSAMGYSIDFDLSTPGVASIKITV